MQSQQEEEEEEEALFADAYQHPPSTTTPLQKQLIINGRHLFPDPSPSHSHPLVTLSEIGGPGAGPGSSQGSLSLPQILK